MVFNIFSSLLQQTSTLPTPKHNLDHPTPTPTRRHSPITASSTTTTPVTTTTSSNQVTLTLNQHHPAHSTPDSHQEQHSTQRIFKSHDTKSRMPTKINTKLVVTINSTGRQAASFVRVASAVGWHVRAHVCFNTGVVADELAELPNVSIVEGDLEDQSLVDKLFLGADLAFINTTHWGDEIKIGRMLADAAKKSTVKHYVYSSMPDHSTFSKHDWQALPLWATKYSIERYIREIDLPATFVYAGVYNNNFTSLPYPLFRMQLQPDKSFVWQAPFHPDDPIPWLDAEHDVGPALLQIFKEGPQRWSGHRIPLTFEVLSPKQVCEAFSKGLGRPVTYIRGPIEFQVPVPKGYHEHLLVLEKILGDQRAPYFGPDMYYPSEAIDLWEGNRGMEEYAREIFPEEERANGLSWMEDEEMTDYDGTEYGDDETDNGSAFGSLPAGSLPHSRNISAPGSRNISLPPSRNGYGHGPGLNFVGSC